ncbi:MAG: DUF4394 domain-containing protein [Rubrivivax sp.]
MKTPLTLLAAALLTACATSEPVGPAAKEEIVAVSAANEILRFNAGQPQRVRDRRPLTGLRTGERLLGIDYRVAKGQLYALGASGQLYRIDPAAAVATPVGPGVALPAGGREWGFDFNPTVDRIRVVSDNGLNLRLHPDTGAVVAIDGPLAYDDGRPGAVVAAGYTYNAKDDKLTTNYALDGAAGTLVHQGSLEGATPVVSPNTGRLTTVGPLGLGPFQQATLDISDVRNAAYAAIRQGERTRWVRIDLATGRATVIGTVAVDAPLVGAAIEP